MRRFHAEMAPQNALECEGGSISRGGVLSSLSQRVGWLILLLTQAFEAVDRLPVKAMARLCPDKHPHNPSSTVADKVDRPWAGVPVNCFREGAQNQGVPERGASQESGGAGECEAMLLVAVGCSSGSREKGGCGLSRLGSGGGGGVLDLVGVLVFFF